MSMSDPIADMLTRIRNGLSARKKSVTMPCSRMKQAIAKVLKDEGYIDTVTVDAEGAIKNMTIGLRYAAGEGAIEEIQRISRPGCRV